MNRKLYFIRANRNKFGGAENYLSRLSIALNKQNINYQVVNSVFPRFLPSWLRAILFNFQVSFLKKDKFYFSLDRITCPDIYRAGDGVHKYYLGIEKKSQINLLHPVYLFLEKRCFNNSKCIIANSSMVRNQIIKVYGIDQKKVKVVHNGIKTKEINYEESFKKLSKEFAITKDQPIILFVGSGFKRKGVAEFLQIVSKIKIDDIKVFVIGKEKNIKFFINLSRKLNIEKQVVFTGPREDVDDFYTISDIFLFPTHYDPFSNTVFEAMNFGNAVFTTKQNGASEILDENYIMDNPEDYIVASNINNLLSDQVKLNNIKQKNRLKSLEFSIEKNLSETLDIINEVIN